jgi:hypothetical protein
LDTVIFPRRDFWVLTPNSNNPESGEFGAWGEVVLGTPFILVARKHLLSDIEALRAAKSLQWDTTKPLLGTDEWFELYHCMVLAQATNATIQNADLWDALRPSVGLGMGLSGGLRIPSLNAWIVGHGPQLTVFGFQPVADIRVIESVDESVVVEHSSSTNTPIDISWPGPGVYRVEASVAGEEAARRVEIVAWEQVAASALHDHISVQVGDTLVSGAHIRPAH